MIVSSKIKFLHTLSAPEFPLLSPSLPIYIDISSLQSPPDTKISSLIPCRLLIPLRLCCIFNFAANIAVFIYNIDVTSSVCENYRIIPFPSRRPIAENVPNQISDILNTEF